MGSGIFMGELSGAERIRQNCMQTVANCILTTDLVVTGIVIAGAWEPIRRAHVAAKHALNITQRQQNRLMEFWPYELQHLKEWGNKPEPESASVIGSRYAGRLLAPVAGEYARILQRVKCNAPRYCTSANERAVRTAYAGRATDEAHARVEGYNEGFAEHNDRRTVKLRRWLEAVMIGNNVITAASPLIAAASHTYAQRSAVALDRVIGAANQMVADQRTPMRGTSVEEWYGGILQTVSGMSPQMQYQGARQEIAREEAARPLDVYREEPMPKLVEDRFSPGNFTDRPGTCTPEQQMMDNAFIYRPRVPSYATIVQRPAK